MKIALSLTRIRRFLAITVASLTAIGITTEAFRYFLDLRLVARPLFSLSFESNVPTWYSSTLLLTCASLLFLIARVKRAEADRFRRHWAVLAGIFLYISIDEASQIHELLNRLVDLPGIFYFSWVIPAGTAVLVFVAAYFPFFLKLPPKTRIGFFLAGCAYVGGALGVELGLGAWTDVHGHSNFGYAFIDMIEESMEIIGASIFCFSLLGYLARETGEVRISVVAPRRAG